MREATFARGIPMGSAELMKRGSFTVHRTKFRGKDAAIHYIYRVMKASQELKAFDNSKEAFEYLVERAEKEESHA